MENLEHGWIVNNQESDLEKMYECSWCGEPIYYGDDYYNINGEHICENCIRDCRTTADD